MVEKMKIKIKMEDEKTSYWLNFAGKTIFYFVIMLILCYFYHFSHIDGGNFIYNEF